MNLKHPEGRGSHPMRGNVYKASDNKFKKMDRG